MPVLGEVANNANPRRRRFMQGLAKPRNQWLAVKFNERFVPPKAAASPAREYKSSNQRRPGFTSHQSPVTSHLAAPSQTLLPIFHRLTPRPANPKFAQFFLQALSVQPDRRRRARHIPAVAHQLLGRSEE